jgi:hypothetical protein
MPFSRGCDDMLIDEGRKLSRGPPTPQAISGEGPEKLFGFQLPAQVAGSTVAHKTKYTCCSRYLKPARQHSVGLQHHGARLRATSGGQAAPQKCPGVKPRRESFGTFDIIMIIEIRRPCVRVGLTQ